MHPNLNRMTKAETYQSILPQIESLVAGQTDMIANMANVAAVLHDAFGFWWTGFYRVIGEELVLGPFQGPIACTRIPWGKGVCGAAWQRAETVIVPNVHEFAGHIACSSASNSEIVVPIIRNKQVIAVLDIDSTEYNTFDTIDKEYLEQIAKVLLLHRQHERDSVEIYQAKRSEKKQVLGKEGGKKGRFLCVGSSIL